MVLPLYRLNAQQLGLLAAATALVLPQVRFHLLSVLDLESSPGPVINLMVSGIYPAMTWVPFVIAGMAIARLDLSRQASHWRLGLAGGALAVLGYGGSWLALRLLPGVPAALQESAQWWSDQGSLDYSSPLIAAPHSETTFAILGNTGCAMIVLAVCLLAMDALPHLRKLVWPIIAVGSMSLTAYVLHIAAIELIHKVEINLHLEEKIDQSREGIDQERQYIKEIRQEGLDLKGIDQEGKDQEGKDLDEKGLDGTHPRNLSMLFGFIVGVSTFAVVWLRVFRRGPMEALDHMFA
ncbi:hypothetical protein [Mesorhizobium carmichaelinearum]|uniref:hypothetical protein n=1 Tax=Mesorhizobium carmichaelinearum TaxID=1208188 RepID=UPI001FCEF01C|nr:hypothetical protein [Mesorhizobium carmichaelinearum]